MEKLSNYINQTKEQRQEHLDLLSDCKIRGTTSTHCRGILADFLDTDIMAKGVDCCHACHNEACSNPKHLYWGTRSENVQDALSQPNAKWGSGGAKGERNSQYGVKPWRNSAVKAHPQMIEVWSNAQRIYNDYYLKDWNFSSYGKGATYFRNKYGYSEATMIKMWLMFPTWNPNHDFDYQNWLNN